MIQNSIADDVDPSTLPFKLEQVATVEVTISFKSGLGDTHRQLTKDAGQKEIVKAWSLAVAAGLRRRTGDNEVSAFSRNGSMG